MAKRRTNKKLVIVDKYQQKLKDIVDLFGGVNALEEATGIAHSLICNYLNKPRIGKDRVPVAKALLILKALNKLNKKLPEDKRLFVTKEQLSHVTYSIKYE